jgi:hypothetical protein
MHERSSAGGERNSTKKVHKEALIYNRQRRVTMRCEEKHTDNDGESDGG